MTHKQIQLSVRKLFRQHSQVSDPRILDRLLHLGEQNLEETLQQVSSDLFIRHPVGIEANFEIFNLDSGSKRPTLLVCYEVTSERMVTKIFYS